MREGDSVFIILPSPGRSNFGLEYIWKYSSCRVRVTIQTNEDANGIPRTGAVQVRRTGSGHGLTNEGAAEKYLRQARKLPE